ncbi:hypothetical protein [Flavobacterium sp. KACC 22763]|uniref:hypothetical protein n=1 Tax=Flavobacterium sp. KACC 22763 TaxID=3025668 RepID=UPI002366C8DE|nr:hypothetical protein [Flavobacterium sp. KACC 22763]WDF64776.1 hypothetical protein PQ463_01210 [Flavobacterium sp. KACC 22763]
METNETEKLQKLQKLTAQYFTTLKPADEANSFTAQFKVVNYLELGCLITDLLKLCILALDNDMHNFSKKDNSSAINVSLILETILHLFPMDEMEFLGFVGEVVE